MLAYKKTGQSVLDQENHVGTGQVQIFLIHQLIENGFETNRIIGVAFVDLYVAYDTVNHNIMLLKLYRMTIDYGIVKIVKHYSETDNSSYYYQEDTFTN